MLYADTLTKIRFEISKSTLTDWDKEQCTYWLNEALQSVWTLAGFHLWPWAYEVTELTPNVTTKKIAWSDFNENPWATCWSTDPRLDASNAFCIRWARIGTDVQLYNSTLGSVPATVWLVRATAVPAYDYTAPADTEEYPDEFERYVLAYVAMRRWEDTLPANSEQLLQKALVRLERERDNLLERAGAHWQTMPYLLWQSVYA